MTRDEAIKALYNIPSTGNAGADFVDSLAALGLLDLDTLGAVESAVTELTGKMIHVDRAPLISVARLSMTTAREIIGLLTKAGFRITRE
jgi:hypothetical protein